MKLSVPAYFRAIFVRFLITAVTGFGTLLSARAQETTAPGSSPVGDSSNAPLRTTVVQGVVAQYLMSPDGVIDGLLLTNNTVVRFPPHLGQVLAQTVKPQDVVRVEGFFEVAGTIHASSIVDLQSRRSVVDAPPSPKNPRPPGPGSMVREPLSASGTIRILTQAKGGEIDGVVLSDGTIIHFPPSVGAKFSGVLQEGHALAATGHGTTNEYGRSLEAEALGLSLSQLQTITGGPGPKPVPSEATQFPRPPRQ